MSTAMAIPGNTANTFLTHLFGAGLSDDRYVVKKFKALVNGSEFSSRPRSPAWEFYPNLAA